MEAFSLLKYWRSSATTADAATSPCSSVGEDGPYFDLEFALPDQENNAGEEASGSPPENEESHRNGEESGNVSDAEEISVQDEDEGGELKFALAGNGDGDPDVAAVSPSDEVFLINGSEESSRIPVFLLKSATRFRVLMLKLKKSKPLEKPEKSAADAGDGRENPAGGKLSGKLFAVKFKVEEVPIVSLFTRDSSSKENHASCKPPPKHGGDDSSSDASGPLEDRKLTKEVVQKNFKMVKPFYIRASKRYVEKLKFSRHPTRGCTAGPEAKEDSAADTPTPSNPRVQPNKPGSNLQAGLKVVRKRLGKSRSASGGVPPQATSNRRDDSLVQVQDGIQGAILHCKKSFNASRVRESSILCRSVSDPVVREVGPSSSSQGQGTNYS